VTSPCRAVADSKYARRRNAALINNAGVVIFGELLHEVDDQARDNMLAVNLTGAFRMAWALLPAMIQAGGGAIVSTSS
jgi:NAD(P)-dependent dehydrogenase (short-subunit alcohol dehydrogenase family)